MDILSHGLWAGAGAAAANKRLKKPLRVGLATFFGVLPDLFAFSILPIWTFVNVLQKDVTFSQLPRDLPPLLAFEPLPLDTFWVYPFTSLLYALSHSLIVFFLIASIVYIVKRRIVWEMSGWLLHIVIDVGTHSYQFYPTPVFWPISFWHFNGIPWHTPWFMAVNYAALVFVYFAFIHTWRRRKLREGEVKPVLSVLRRDIRVKLAVRKIVGKTMRKRVEEV
ncbi:MAG: hypothetical protein HY435_02845 [Candidatus Liptonbacteria bacterium]|nr:hypothetical protein [Candidatus Liptonbacteria bacterium]